MVTSSVALAPSCRRPIRTGTLSGGRTGAAHTAAHPRRVPETARRARHDRVDGEAHLGPRARRGGTQAPSAPRARRRSPAVRHGRVPHGRRAIGAVAAQLDRRRLHDWPDPPSGHEERDARSDDRSRPTARRPPSDACRPRGGSDRCCDRGRMPAPISAPPATAPASTGSRRTHFGTPSAAVPDEKSGRLRGETAVVFDVTG
jgi:hypothetical protein